MGKLPPNGMAKIPDVAMQLEVGVEAWVLAYHDQDFVLLLVIKDGLIGKLETKEGGILRSDQLYPWKLVPFFRVSFPRSLVEQQMGVLAGVFLIVAVLNFPTLWYPPVSSRLQKLSLDGIQDSVGQLISNLLYFSAPSAYTASSRFLSSSIMNFFTASWTIFCAMALSSLAIDGS